MTNSTEKSTPAEKIGLWYALFGLLLLLTSVLFYILASEQPVNANGIKHATFETMNVGGSAERHASPVIWIGLLYAVLQYVFLISSLTLGLSRLKPAVFFIGLFGSLCVAAVTTLFVLYDNSALDAPTMTLGFPTPSAWMVYVVWPVPVLFIIIYCVKFEDWFYTAENRQRFEQLLASKEEGEAN
jgi:hypothetical protein